MVWIHHNLFNDSSFEGHCNFSSLVLSLYETLCEHVFILLG